MLFMLVTECFIAMLKLADGRELLKPLCRAPIKQRASLYANDAVIFISLVAQDLILIRDILSLFDRDLGLTANY